jgi:hypothetical protein
MGKQLIIMFSLYFISSVQFAGHEIIVTLENKNIVTLSKDHKLYDYYIKLINHALTRKHPIGLLISKDNKIIEVQRADNDVVDNVIRDKNTVKILFMGHDGIFFLDYDHPHFDLLYARLNKSKADSQRVWFIAQLPDLKLLDLIMDENK